MHHDSIPLLIIGLFNETPAEPPFLSRSLPFVSHIAIALQQHIYTASGFSCIRGSLRLTPNYYVMLNLKQIQQSSQLEVRFLMDGVPLIVIAKYHVSIQEYQGKVSLQHVTKKKLMSVFYL